MMVSAKIPLAATRLKNRFELNVTQMFVEYSIEHQGE